MGGWGACRRGGGLSAYVIQGIFLCYIVLYAVIYVWGGAGVVVGGAVAGGGQVIGTYPSASSCRSGSSDYWRARYKITHTLVRPPPEPGILFIDSSEKTNDK